MPTGTNAGRKARYPRSARVRARPEFDAVFANGRRAANPMLALHYLADDRPPRLGLAVSRKVDTKAVIRNRIKRVLRDYFRLERYALPGGAYVVVARKQAASATGAELTSAFRHALRKLSLPPSNANGTMPPASIPSAKPPMSDGATSPHAP